MIPQSQTPADLLEQAHLAMLRGNLAEARSVLERLLTIEPANEAAQDMRATVVAKQAAQFETARLQTGDFPGAAPQAQTGSFWTQLLQDPTSALLSSPSAGKWPRPLLLIVCLAAGVLTILLSSRYTHGYHSSWLEDIAFGLALGVTIFIWMVRRKR